MTRIAAFAALVLVAAPVSAQTAAPAERKWAISAALGLVFPGSVDVEGNSADTETGFGLRAAADFFVAPKLSLGVYLERISTTAKAFGQSADVTVTAIGGTFVGRFGDPSQPHFRAGLGLAYQIDTVSYPGSKDSTGFGISPFVGYVFPMKDVAFFGHLGLNAQPSGGNSDVTVTWGPIFQIYVGAEFGK